MHVSFRFWDFIAFILLPEKCIFIQKLNIFNSDFGIKNNSHKNIKTVLFSPIQHRTILQKSMQIFFSLSVCNTYYISLWVDTNISIFIQEWLLVDLFSEYYHLSSYKSFELVVSREFDWVLKNKEKEAETMLLFLFWFLNS